MRGHFRERLVTSMAAEANDEFMRDLQTDIKACSEGTWHAIRCADDPASIRVDTSGLREHAREFFRKAPSAEELPTLHSDAWTQLPMGIRCLVYWREIDNLVFLTRVAVWRLLQRRGLAALTTCEDVSTCAALARGDRARRVVGVLLLRRHIRVERHLKGVAESGARFSGMRRR